MTSRSWKTTSPMRLLLGAVLGAATLAPALAQVDAVGIEELPDRPPAAQDGAVSLRYRVVATQPRLNRRVMGPVRRWVQGVPAEPVDSMCWNGEGSTPIEGKLIIDVQPMRSLGSVYAEWTDRHGDWTYRQDRFIHPDHHTSGVRIGSSINDRDYLLNVPIAHNVYLHGDTGAAMPVIPTLFTYLAAWGPAEVTLNGRLFESTFEIPAPLWDAHLMVTEGVRREDGTVRTLSGEIYNPSRASEGAVETGDIEAHLTWHDDLFPMTSNVPPPFSFFYHLVFEDVSIEILQGDPEPTAPRDRDRRGKTLAPTRNVR